jgi:ABC-type multidrug transport system fused ATPase/permease subunit
VFRGSLAYNIRYKRPDATDEEVYQAALSAGLGGTLQRLPEGLQTMVGEGGMGLSVGEKQRIQIARVLVARPRILILDEATSNLDYATEGKIIDTLEVLRESSTVLVIAHKYTMVRDADHVIVLSDGAVVEEGSPAELIEKGGWFAAFAHTMEEDGDAEDEVEEESDEAGDEDGQDESDEAEEE